MARKHLLRLGRAMVASGSLLLGPQDGSIASESVASESLEPARELRQRSEASAVGESAHPRAWTERERILNRSHADPRAALFVDLVLRHDHEDYAVQEAAAALGFTRQYLRRLSLRWFGHPPGTVISLARLESVTRAILQSSESIAVISVQHNFRNAANLSRQFLRFVGVRPGALRRR